MHVIDMIPRLLASTVQSLNAASAAREMVLVLTGFMATLLNMEPIFGQLLLFNTALDVSTFWLSKGRRVRTAKGLSQALGESLRRTLENVAILGVALSFANSFVLFGYAADVAVAYTAGRAGYGTLDHVLKADNDFRLFFLRTWQAALKGLGFFQSADGKPQSGPTLEEHKHKPTDGPGPISPHSDD